MTSEEALPAGLRRLWGVSEPARLGRPAELDVPQVVRAAVELADRDGLAGVTLPKVAKVLGFTSMSLYRYVGSKDELLELMRDAAIGPPPSPEDDTMSWRDGLRWWARGERQLYLARPWLVRIPLSGPPSGPNQIAWMEVALAVLRETGLGWAEKIGIMNLISGYVRHSALLSQDLLQGRTEGLDQSAAEQEYGRALVTLIDPERFPEAARMFASPVFESAPSTQDDTDDPDFTFGLELILDGIATAVARAGG